MWEAGRLEEEPCDLSLTRATEPSEKTQDREPTSERPTISEYSYGNDQSINPLGQIFRDKTFQTTFHVSQPLPTSLQEYFERQASKAFGGCSWIPDNDIHRLWVVYSYYIWNIKKIALPRNVKIFINEVTALATVWQHAIPLPVLGVYVILKKCGILCAGTAEDSFKIRDSFLHMLEAWGYKKSSSGNGVPSLDDAISAVESNVDPERVLELTLLKQLTDLLRSGDTDQILSRFSPILNFVKLLEMILTNYSEAWITTSPATLGYSALVLNDISWRTPILFRGIAGKF